jgi:hypothetical protein
VTLVFYGGTVTRSAQARYRQQEEAQMEHQQQTKTPTKQTDHRKTTSTPDPSQNLAPMSFSPSAVMQLQRTVGNQAVQRLISGRTGSVSKAGNDTLQRDGPTNVRDAPKVPQVDKATLDGSEAASLIELRLFDSDGYFAAVRQRIGDFKDDMVTELGWYAGDKKEKDKKRSPVADVGMDIAKEQAKKVGKKAVSILVQGLSAGAIGAGPAGAAAAVLVPLITKLLSDDYNPVVTKVALKPPHQLFIESLLQIISAQQGELRNQWTKSRTEAIKQEGVAGLTRFAAQIEQATQQIRQRLYPEMVAAYMAFAPAREVTLETPHSKYTGEKQGTIDFFGYGAGAHFASKIKSGEIYVEIDASSGYNTSGMRIKRTVVPELPSTVLAELNDPNLPKDMGIAWGTLPYKRLIMEAGNSNFPARVTYEPATSKALPTESPHYSAMFCTEVAKAHGNQGNTTLPGQRFSTLELSGASLLYTWVVTRPLSELHFSA